MADMTRAREEIDDLAGELASTGSMKGMIFGHRGLKTSARKMFCFEHGDALVFKLGDAAYDDAMALDGATVFKPMADRPAMGGWVVVPSSKADQWPRLARAAYDYVSALSKRAK